MLERAQGRALRGRASYGATRGTASPATFRPEPRLDGPERGQEGPGRKRSARPETHAEAAVDQSLTDRQARVSSDLWTAHKGAEPGQAQTPAGPGVLGPDEAAEPSSPPELPRRKPRVSHRRDPGQAEPVAAANAGKLTGEPSDRARSGDPGLSDGSACARRRGPGDPGAGRHPGDGHGAGAGRGGCTNPGGAGPGGAGPGGGQPS